MVRKRHRNLPALSRWETPVLESSPKLVMISEQASLWQETGSELLPRDGSAAYYAKLFSHTEASDLFHALFGTIPWEQDEVVLFGQKRILSRKMAWIGDSTFCYSYSGSRKTASPWTPALLHIKKRVETTTSHPFNSCLLNLYHDGMEGMGWHSDDEKTLGRNPVIASVSFGAERVFRMKHSHSKEVVSVTLEHGSLLVMKGATQHHWVHAMPKTKKIHTPRINLTFRTFLQWGATFPDLLCVSAR